MNPFPSSDWSPLDLPLTDPRHPFHEQHMEMALEEAATAFRQAETLGTQLACTAAAITESTIRTR